MIYRYNSFKKEIRFDFTDRKTGNRRIPIMGTLAAFLTLAVHFILQTMADTVLSDALSEFMMRTYFSLLFTYYAISMTVLVIDYAVNYRDLTFAEIANNRWYLQAKMGYNPTTLVLNKIAARFVTIAFNWSLGYILTLTFGLFLKYTFIPEYTITLFVMGLIDSLVLVTLILTISLVKEKNEHPGSMVALIGFLYWFAKVLTGRYGKVSDPLYMRDLSSYFSLFEDADDWILFTIIASCLYFISFGARYAAYYFRHNLKAIHILPDRYDFGYVQDIRKSARFRRQENKRLITTIQREDKILNIIGYEKVHERAERLARWTNRLLTAFATVIVVLMLIFNLIVLVISAAQGGIEISLSGTIPYIFHSTTMEPAINKNDLVFFQQIDVQDPLYAGEIVILNDNFEVYIERIVEISGDLITVDIDHYPELAREDAMRRTVDRSQIYGRLSGRNRWLGALIHFANTIIGRILFLLIPSILLFYHDRIFNLLKRWYRGGVSEEQIEAQRALHEKRHYERLNPKSTEVDE